MSAAESTSIPTVDEVNGIVALKDPVIRNLRITTCYSRLSSAMVGRTGQCANWCTFATWASRQAGATIRGEDLYNRLLGKASESSLLHPVQSVWRMLLRRGMFYPETRLGRVVRAIHSPFDAFERASDAVGRGNRKVFEEIGLEFARYVHTCSPEDKPDSDAFASFLSGLKPGDPPDGQTMLRQAFTFYQQQRFETDPARRAQLVCLANLEVGLHEQTRLQAEISEAVLAGPVTAQDLGERIARAIFKDRLDVKRRFIAALLAAPAVRFRGFVETLTRQVVTESMMVLTLPRGLRLSLGRHLDHGFPGVFAQIEVSDLRNLLDRYEPSGNAKDDCGANDWCVLNQRMHYIAHLFRAFHDGQELFDPPFTQDQIRQFENGQLPDGPL